jgi:hypothetical protein
MVGLDAEPPSVIELLSVIELPSVNEPPSGARAERETPNPIACSSRYSSSGVIDTVGCISSR